MAYMRRNRRGSVDNPAPVPEAPEMDSDNGKESGEKLSAFVPMEFFGGKAVKEGDKETVKVVAIDPESGEVQIECMYGGGGEKVSTEEAFDEAMPEEEMV